MSSPSGAASAGALALMRTITKASDLMLSSKLRLILSPRFARPVGWACVLLIAVLSLIPREMEIRTGFAPSLEHAFAYACTGAALVLGYPRQRWWVMALALGAYSGVLEGLQAFSPGRRPGLDGFVASTLGAITGAHACRGPLARLLRSNLRPAGEELSSRAGERP